MGFEGLNRVKVVSESYDDPEKGEKILERDVLASRDFRDLIVNVINRFDDWKYSNGDPISKSELAEIINDVANGQKGTEFVTSRYGLRAKVEELLVNQSVATEISGEEQRQYEVIVPQEELARQYLEAFRISQEAREQWKKLDQARISNEAESGHMQDFESADDRYRSQMAEVSREIDRQQEMMNSIFDKLSDETKDAYLRPQAGN